MIVEWKETNTQALFAWADDFLAREADTCLIVVCEVNEYTAHTLKERLIAIQHLTHRHYSKTRDVPVRVVFVVDGNVEKAILESSVSYMKKMQRGENKNILGFDRTEVEALEKYL